MVYIQRRQGGELETVDELNRNDFATFKEFRKELRRLLNEYNLSDPSAIYYRSQRACKSWND